jgi:DNA-binding transcriptional regulator YdaS (Cro superfamily)
MDLKTYITDAARKAALAEATGADPQWLWQIATGWRNKRPSPELAVKIETATGGEVPRHLLRPDIFVVSQNSNAS